MTNHSADIAPEARDAILAWFDARGRAFPFRGVRDPWAILVSEAMAQQTQIARASDKWQGFMARFPTVESLAAASPADVLREWRGLGYNRRALNLRRAAIAIVDEHGGRVPDDLDALQRLPGVGPYTARAVAALAFGRPVGAVDTNVRRVLGRLVGGAVPPGGRALQGIADAAVPADRPGDWTHAVMDVGATFCKPARPDCAECPARAWCRFAAGEGTNPATTRAPKARKPPRAAGERAFPGTSRWLRGRLLDALRDATGPAWVAIEAPIGQHDAAAVEVAIGALASEGLVERHPRTPGLVRLPLD